MCAGNESQRTMSNFLFSHSLPYSFETGSLPEPEVCLLDWANWPVSTQHLSVSNAGVIGTASFYMCCGDLNQGPDVCTAYPLTTDPSLQPHEQFLKRDK